MSNEPRNPKFPADIQRAMVMAEVGIEALPTPEERDAGHWAISIISRGITRTMSRKESDNRTDHQRRQLIGARVSRSDAARYRACANLSGRSLYRFILDALAIEASKTELITHKTWDGKQHNTVNPYPPEAPQGSSSLLLQTKHR